MFMCTAGIAMVELVALLVNPDGTIPGSRHLGQRRAFATDN